MEWTNEMQAAFDNVKKKLTQKPLLYALYYENSFKLLSDASDKDISAVLALRKYKGEHSFL